MSPEQQILVLCTAVSFVFSGLATWVLWDTHRTGQARWGWWLLTLATGPVGALAWALVGGPSLRGGPPGDEWIHERVRHTQ